MPIVGDARAILNELVIAIEAGEGPAAEVTPTPGRPVVAVAGGPAFTFGYADGTWTASSTAPAPDPA